MRHLGLWNFLSRNGISLKLNFSLFTCKKSVLVKKDIERFSTRQVTFHWKTSFYCKFTTKKLLGNEKKWQFFEKKWQKNDKNREKFVKLTIFSIVKKIFCKQLRFSKVCIELLEFDPWFDWACETSCSSFYTPDRNISGKPSPFLKTLSRKRDCFDANVQFDSNIGQEKTEKVDCKNHEPKNFYIVFENIFFTYGPRSNASFGWVQSYLFEQKFIDKPIRAWTVVCW